MRCARIRRMFSSPSYLSRIQLSWEATKLAQIRTEHKESTPYAVRQTEYSTAKPFNSIPTPHESWPVIGFTLELQKRMRNVGDKNFLHYTTHQCGPIWKDKVFGNPIATVSEPEVAEVVMRNDGKWPSRAPTLEDMFQWIHRKINVLDGLITASGPNWKRLRTAMGKQVTPSRIRNFMSALYTVTDDLCNHLASIRNQEGVVANLLPNMQNWTVQSISRVVFNEHVDAHSGKDPANREMVEAAVGFNDAFSTLQGTFFPLFKVYPTKKYRRYVQALQRVRAVGTKLLKKRFDDFSKDIREGKVDATSAVGLLEQWLMEGKLSENEIVMQAADMLAAGTDTTSITGTFMLHELAKNPQTQEAVRREVLEAVGADKEPTHEQMQELTLVRGCVRETLRLYPITSTNSRVMPNDIVLKGYQIPAGTIAVVVTSLPGFDPYHFPNPLQFDPHRWEKNAREIHPFASIPFGFGQRGCYGRRIAELELHLLVVRVLQRFQLSTKQSHLARRQGFIMRPTEPVMLQLTDREK